MTILGRGDLSPPRRHHRGRHAIATVLVAVVVLAAAGWFAWHVAHGRSAPRHVTAQPCPTPTLPPSPAVPGQVTVAVLNTTDRVGLAHAVASELRGRGFRIGRVGNSKARQPGVATVAYAAGLLPEALAVAEQVPGAVVSPGASTGVALELGPDYRALADPAAAAAARAHDVSAASPRPTSCRTS